MNKTEDNDIIKFYNNIIDYIDNSNLSNSNQKIVKQKIEKTKSLVNSNNSNKLNIIVFGDFNSGKTTLINSLISTLLESNEDFKDFLPKAITENTYYITIIEKSNDSSYSLEHLKNGKLYNDIHYPNKDNIIGYLKDFDENATNIIKRLAENEAKEEIKQSTKESNELNEYTKKSTKDLTQTTNEEAIPTTLIKIKIPNFPETIRIIDSPGLTNTKIRKEIIAFLNETCLANIFLTVRSFTQEKVIDRDYRLAKQEIIKDFPNSVHLLILSQVDDLLKLYIFNESDDLYDIRKMKANLKSFLYPKEIEQNYYKLFILSCLKCLEGDKVYKDGVIRLKSCLLELATYYKNNYSNNLLDELKNKAKLILEDYNANRLLKRKFTKDETDLIDGDFYKVVHEFEKKVIILFENLKVNNDKDLKEEIYRSLNLIMNMF